MCKLTLTASCSSCHFATLKLKLVCGIPIFFSLSLFFSIFFLYSFFSSLYLAVLLFLLLKWGSGCYPRKFFKILHCCRWVYCVSYKVSNQAFEVDDRIVLIYWSLGNPIIPSGYRIAKNNALTYLSKVPGVGGWFTWMGGLWHTWFTCEKLLCFAMTALLLLLLLLLLMRMRMN